MMTPFERVLWCKLYCVYMFSTTFPLIYNHNLIARMDSYNWKIDWYYQTLPISGPPSIQYYKKQIQRKFNLKPHQ